MKNLIYYPSFEPTDLNWIKYALIYIDSFSPIIPDSQKEELSDFYKNLIDNTDLVNIHRPHWQQGDNAATKALKEIEFIHLHPEQYRDKLNSVNIIRTWKNPANWEYLLCEEKFNMTFKYYCIENGLGAHCDEGLLTSKELASFYMTFLAEEVAFETGANPITDVESLDNLSTYLRTKNPGTENSLKAAKSVINLSLPTDIQNINIGRFIKFRNQSGISDLRKTFNSTLDSFYQSLENERDPSQYINQINSINKEFVKEVGLLLGRATVATLAAMIVIHNGVDGLETAKIVADGTVVVTAGAYSINKAWALNKDKRSARKFLSKVQSI